ncbi:YihY family inner membrane protein [Pusillimonas sp. TS35]|uniref:YihY family inner membrane protein n=1 Tax=Paracandidimonas lactea TaxID=2895524 RepID=UPI00136A02A4|nr:YihY family inner membrane protein [Paracandidimonas lactea]MYN11990.1 YihY family inner membrane protein [Pusillimonas sp. TS35]
MPQDDTNHVGGKASTRLSSRLRSTARDLFALPANSGAVARFVIQRAGDKKLMQVASSLTFTTVLSLVPLLTVVLSLFTAFPMFNEFQLALQNFLTASLMPPSVSDTVMQYLNQFAAKASGLTAVGSLFLIVTSISLIMTIDEAFNDIWQVRQQRPIRQRMLAYWALVSLGPILAGASPWALSLLARKSDGVIGDLSQGGFALSLTPLLITGTAFTLLFRMVPNCKVAWRDAFVGGIGTAVVLEIMRAGFAYYLARFPSYTVIYGAFATVPIFLMWIYLSWLVILVGATVAAILPSLRQRRWALVHYTGDEFIDALRALRLLWQAQAEGPSPGLGTAYLCDRLQIHQDELARVLCRLKDLGYAVDTMESGDVVWVLSCDQRAADIGRLVDAMLVDRRQPALRGNQALLDAIAKALVAKPPRLESLFDTAPLHERHRMVQNTMNDTTG